MRNRMTQGLNVADTEWVSTGNLSVTWCEQDCSQVYQEESPFKKRKVS